MNLAMELNGLWRWWVVLVFVGILVEGDGINRCLGCLEQERAGLLQLKASLNSSYPNAQALPSWDSSAGDCCVWERVGCRSGRVVQLLLNDTGIPLFQHSWYLNSSLFLPFEELTYLDLSWIGIAGWVVEDEGFERLSKLEALRLDGNGLNNSFLHSLRVPPSFKSLSLTHNELDESINFKEFGNMSNLKELDLSFNQINDFIMKSEGHHLLEKLEVLDLTSNSFDNSILLSLSALPLLKILSLSRNNLKGSINTTEFSNMSNLKELYLSLNRISDFLITTGGHHLLEKLEVLYLSYNSFNNSILPSLSALPSLKILSLRGNNLNGSINTTGCCQLSNLELLDLSGNGLNGELPSCMRNMTSLRYLDLSSNQFTGDIATSPLSSLTSLQFLSISHNHFVIPLSFDSFFNHSKLKAFLGKNNKLFVSDEPHQLQAPLFQLDAFVLSNCASNKLIVRCPHFLYYQNELRMVDLSYNNLGGTLPSWLLENNTQLDNLRISNNSLTGPFLLPAHPNPRIWLLDISNNHIEGHLPTNMSMVFPKLEMLNMSNNGFQGNIPANFRDLKFLFFLDLSHNNFSGQIPEQLAIGCTSLFFLKLSSNILHGQLFQGNIKFNYLSHLYLDNNRFVGKIPDGLQVAFGLSVLDISNNMMSGNIPRWIGNLSSLSEVAMSNNHFEGPIPIEFCQLRELAFLDVSANNLSGSIPSCFNSSRIRHVHLSENKLSGSLEAPIFGNSSSLVTLDLANNRLTGNIPTWIGTLSSLSILLLKSNHFERQIPDELCHLDKLSILDVSQNNLYGSIPACFSGIPFKPTPEKSVTGNWSYRRISESISLWSYMVGLNLYWIGDDLSVDFNLGSYVLQEVEFTTKRNTYAYKGSNLDYMSGIDLSCNHFTGEIPPEFGRLREIRALNLSHNNLAGSIPATFSNLSQVESLDLSCNSLSGTIPSQLIDINALAVFNVSYNNLSGKIPDQKAQFGTFDESSYMGNPLLCGPPLINENCKRHVVVQNSSKDDDGFMDMETFYVSCTVSFVIAFLTVVGVLWINPYWRRSWFHMVEVCATSCYYFVEDMLRKLSNARGM